MNRIPNPVAQWTEPETASAAMPLTMRYLAYDAGTNTYTITTDRNLAAAELVDVGGTGEFTVNLLGAIPSSAPRQKFVAVGTAVIHVY